MLFFIILGIIIVILLVYILITYSCLIRLQNMVKENFAILDTYLKQRWEIVPSLVEVVKEYIENENTTFNQLILLKNYSYDKMQMDEKIKVNERLTEEISNIKIMAENNAKLKSSQLFIEFSNEIKQIEYEIINSRKKYNEAVKVYNDKIQMSPENIIANFFSFEIANMYEADFEEKCKK